MPPLTTTGAVIFNLKTITLIYHKDFFMDLRVNALSFLDVLGLGGKSTALMFAAWITDFARHFLES